MRSDGEGSWRRSWASNRRLGCRSKRRIYLARDVLLLARSSFALTLFLTTETCSSFLLPFLFSLADLFRKACLSAFCLSPALQLCCSYFF